MNALFVDDEPQVLRALERMLDAADVEWEAEFAGDAAEALEMLANEDFDAIITDMRMPGMDGAELLHEVSKLYPHIVRIVLSGQADKEAVLRAVQPMHQYLSKPCAAETLKSTISRACAMRDTLSSESLRKTITNLPGLPSIPSVYAELNEAIQSEDFALTDVGRIIEKDMAMSAKILQLVNSAAFGLGKQVHSPGQAACMLGVDVIKALVLTTGVFTEFVDNSKSEFSLETLMTHSLNVANFAKQIARAEGMAGGDVNDAYTAGMLHDVGKLILATSDTEAYSRILQTAASNHTSLWEAEHEFLNTDHAAVGAYLLNLWGLPQSIIEVVSLHHRPEQAEEKSLSVLSVVWAANEVANGADDQELSEYLATIECEGKIASWRDLCLSQEE